MHVFRGKYVMCEISDDVYEWPVNKEEIQDKVKELDAIIDSMETGKTQPWPGTEKMGDLIIW